MHSKWAVQALEDAVAYARENEPRPIDSQTEQASEISKVFYGSLWDSLKGRGWKEEETESQISDRWWCQPGIKFRWRKELKSSIRFKWR